MGTPGFAVPTLRALIESENDVVAVVTKPDTPKGRGRRVIPPPIKTLTIDYNIPVLQPEKIKTEEFNSELKEYEPDMICVAAYGKILPKNILDLPPHGCINVHASLLPKYRGAAPVNWAIIRGEEITGITTMMMDEGMDTGDMLLQKEVRIEVEDDAESLSEKLSIVGAKLLTETIRLQKRGRLPRIPQDHSKATYAPMLKKEDGIIDWRKTSEEIKYLIRGTLPWPGAHTTIDGKNLKLYKAKVSDGIGKPGEVILSESGILRVATGDGSIDITEIQIEGGKRLPTQAFLIGRKIPRGTIFGK
ncbi:MAG: methionyl-tRNA formyltransferase [Thermodesulfobacteriota bacterium]